MFSVSQKRYTTQLLVMENGSDLANLFYIYIYKMGVAKKC